jgi:hypothetical protein
MCAMTSSSPWVGKNRCTRSPLALRGRDREPNRRPARLRTRSRRFSPACARGRTTYPQCGHGQRSSVRLWRAGARFAPFARRTQPTVISLTSRVRNSMPSSSILTGTSSRLSGITLHFLLGGTWPSAKLTHMDARSAAARPKTAAQRSATVGSPSNDSLPDSRASAGDIRRSPSIANVS